MSTIFVSLLIPTHPIFCCICRLPWSPSELLGTLYVKHHKLIVLYISGIAQAEVDKAVPIQTCLMLFKKWTNEQVEKYRLAFHDTHTNLNKVTFVTWSDWDLNICLPNECRRKGILKPKMFNSWIDLRALYRVSAIGIIVDSQRYYVKQALKQAILYDHLKFSQTTSFYLVNALCIVQA